MKTGKNACLKMGKKHTAMKPTIEQSDKNAKITASSTRHTIKFQQLSKFLHCDEIKTFTIDYNKRPIG